MTMEGVVIAPLPPTRWAEAVALWEATGLTRPWNDAHADVARACAGPSSTVLGAFAEPAEPAEPAESGRAASGPEPHSGPDQAASLKGALAGTAMVGCDGHRAWVYYLAVDPGWRRRGVGRALMAAGEAWAHERGMPKIQLMVRQDNAEVIAFYAGLGYLDDGCVVLGRRWSR